ARRIDLFTIVKILPFALRTTSGCGTVDKGPRPMRPLLAALVALLAAPGAAHAAGDGLVARELPLHGSRTLSAHAPIRFDLLGLHWRGSGGVVFRTRAADGRWSAWRPAAPEDDL